MAQRPRIGVTGNHRRWAPSWWCTVVAIYLAGGLAERISIHHPPTGKPLDGLVIGGGNDISPEHYGGDLNAKIKADPERDQLELHWIRYALANHLPLLGICRGAQLINVALGGTLHQDIRLLRKHTHNRPGLLPTKRVRLAPNSQLAGICGKTHLRVNSLHHQAINKAGSNVVCVGWDLDQIIQAVESFSDCKIIGVQWHPEYLFYVPSQMSIFRWLLQITK